jgi:hypothetical protein
VVTNLANAGHGTLRAGINLANRLAHSAGGPRSLTIRFSPKVWFTLDIERKVMQSASLALGRIQLQTPLPVIDAHLVIAGPNALGFSTTEPFMTLVRAQSIPNFRIFTIAQGAKVAINSISMGSGIAPNGGAIENAGSLSIYNVAISGNSASGGNGGAIMNTGKLSVSASDFIGNSATGNDARGGAIENTGTLTIDSSRFTFNSATSSSAGGSASGGAIDTSGMLHVTNSKFLGNSAKALAGNGTSRGGAISGSGTLSVTSSQFQTNAAMGGFASYGGAIDSSGSLTVAGTTFAGGAAGAPNAVSTQPASDYGYGGAINNSGALSVTNSTFYQALALGLDGSFGGAIADSGTASISYVTTDHNSAASGGGIAITSGAQSVVDSIDSIYQNIQGGNLFVTTGEFHSSGHNLFSDDPGAIATATDLINTDPLLDSSLLNHGGLTDTVALLSGSPARNAGIPIAGITTDQRAVPRPSSGATDIGAFQTQTQPPLVVTSVRLSGTNSIVLTFSEPLVLAPAQSLGNYSLMQSSGLQQNIVIRSARYNAVLETVTLTTRTRLSPHKTYGLTVTGKPPGGLSTPAGLFLAGAAPDKPGSNYFYWSQIP